MNNSNYAALAIFNGGKYSFYQSTFANYFNMIGTAGPAYSLYLSNESEDESTTNPLIQAIFANSIFYNERTPNAIAFNNISGAAFNYLFDTNMIKNADPSTLDVTSTNGFVGNIVDNPLFIDGTYTANNLRLGEESPAKGKGKQTYANQYPNDIFGISRVSLPNLGAIQ